MESALHGSGSAAPPRPPHLLDANDARRVRRFVDGRLDPEDFEAWVSGFAEGEAAFGFDFYVTLVAANYGDRDEVYEARAQLGVFIARWYPPACICESRDTDHFIVGLSSEAYYAFSTIAENVICSDRRWLSLGHCSVCGSDWFMGSGGDGYDSIDFQHADSVAVASILSGGDWPKSVLSHVGERKRWPW